MTRVSAPVLGSGLVALVALMLAPAVLAQRCPPAGSAIEPRLRISLFRYEPTTDNAAASQFQLFASLLNTKVSTLADEVKASRSASGAAKNDFPDGVYLYTRAGQPLDDTLQNPNRRKTHWEDTAALELLRGRVWATGPGKPYVVQSDIYIGELRGQFPRPEISVKLPIVDSEASTTSDSHSVITYYVLAMEAKQLSCDQAIARGLLARALSILKDIRRRGGNISGDLAELERIVVEQLTK